MYTKTSNKVFKKFVTQSTLCQISVRQIISKYTHPPWIIKFEPIRRGWIVSLAPQEPRQPAIPVHHY